MTVDREKLREELARLGFNGWYGRDEYDEHPVQGMWERTADAQLAGPVLSAILTQAESAERVAAERDEAPLDDRLRAAGMFTIPEMMGETPLTRWETHAGMTNLAAFDAWLDRKVAEYLRMAAGYQLGDKDKGDELYEWVTAHSAAFRAIRTNFKAATRAPNPTPADAGAEGGPA